MLDLLCEPVDQGAIQSIVADSLTNHKQRRHAEERIREALHSKRGWDFYAKDPGTLYDGDVVTLLRESAFSGSTLPPNVLKTTHKSLLTYAEQKGIKWRLPVPFHGLHEVGPSIDVITGEYSKAFRFANISGQESTVFGIVRQDQTPKLAYEQGVVEIPRRSNIELIPLSEIGQYIPMGTPALEEV